MKTALSAYDTLEIIPKLRGGAGTDIGSSDTENDEATFDYAVEMVSLICLLIQCSLQNFSLIMGKSEVTNCELFK